MITVLTGENSFALQRALAERAGAFVAEHGDMAVERLDAAEADTARIRESLQSAPFLAARKLVILRNPGANKAFIEQAPELLADLDDVTEVLVVDPKIDKRSSFYKFLKKAAVVQEYSELDEAALARWLVAEAKAAGGTLSAGDARLLVERVGLEQQLAAHELEKLLLYNPVITREAMVQLTEAAPQSSIFELLDAAFRGDTRRAVALYREQREQKVDAARIIAMIAWQLRVLALIKTAGSRSPQAIASEAKISPFVMQKSQGIAAQLSLTRLRQLITALLELDARSKRGNVDLDEALQHYFFTLGA